MTDEEKKAIEDLKRLKQGLNILNNSFFITEKDEVDVIAIEIVLNLIEKQTKEIEELKAKRSWVHIKENGEVEPLFYVSEDKIKAKIEEVEQWELYNMKIPKLSTLDERLGAKIGIKYVLKSLLEGSKYMLDKEELEYLQEIINNEILSYLESGYKVTSDYVIVCRKILKKLNLKEIYNFDKE